MAKRKSLHRRVASATALCSCLAALLIGAGCTRAEAGPVRQEQLCSDGCAAAPSGKLVIDWNTTLFEIATRTDEYEDPFVHLRALTMMHLAMHDAVNGVSPKYATYATSPSDASADPVVAAAAAAHHVLVSEYPAQRAVLDTRLSAIKSAAKNAAAAERGVALGNAAAHGVLSARTADGSRAVEPYTPSQAPGRHRFVPPFELVYRPAWRNVEPFGIASGDQFRSRPPPALGSDEYAASYSEVSKYGRAQGSTRTPEQSFYADWWYELSEIGWNRIARVSWADQEKQDLWSAARLFALLNVGLMDAYIAGWDSKLHYDFWRPYTAIRAGNTDGNAATLEEPSWESYCVTPPVQDYPSTHSALGAAAAAVLRGVYGRDVPFSMESTSSKPPGQQRSFTSFQQAALENADSRVACGIHFRFATHAGLKLGDEVGQHVLRAILTPNAEGS